MINGNAAVPLLTELLIIAPSGAGSEYINANFNLSTCDKLGAITIPSSIGKGRSLGELTSNCMSAISVPGGLSSDQCVMVCLSLPVDEEDAFGWCETLFQAIKPQRVLVLGEIQARLYHRAVESGCLLKLESDSWKAGSIVLPRSVVSIEAPFLVEGLTAAVMAHVSI